MKSNSIKYICMTGLFAGLIMVSVAYLFHIPIGSTEGYIHLGDMVIYVAATFLPVPYAIGAAALGGAMADIIAGAAVWAPFTAVIKALMVLPFTGKNDKLLCRRNAAAAVISGVICVVGYYFAEVILVGNFAAPLASAPMNVIQAVGNGAAFILLALAFDKTGLTKRLRGNH